MSHAELIQSFSELTGASAEESAFYLEASAWNLEAATQEFFGASEMNDEPRHAAPQPSRVPQAQAPPAQVQRHTQQPSYVAPAAKPAKSQPRRGGPVTLGDLGGGDDCDCSDDEEQKYYAGGEKSGQMIVGGPKKDIAKGVMDSAKARGATVVDENQKPTPSHFGGSGYKLGDTSTPTAKIAPKPAEKPEEVTRTITFWRNGFTVDNGPLRSLEDPANRQFMQDINDGHVPRELEVAGHTSGKYGVNLVDARHEDYKEPPKPKYTAFAGSGQSLGSSAPTPTPVATQQRPAALAPSNLNFSVNESEPTTSIKITLSDGTRMVSKFNLTHTIGDIQNFIRLSRPTAQPFDIASDYPKKVFSDPKQTIKDAGLAGGVIRQQLK